MFSRKIFPFSLLIFALLASTSCSGVRNASFIPECGLSSIRPPARINPNELNPRIVLGTPTNWGQIPWQVVFLINGLDVLCGGSILNDRWILTAAHCVDETNMKGNLIEVVIGELERTNGMGMPSRKELFRSQIRRIDKVIIHERYSRTFVLFDIALVKLREPIKFHPANEQIRPICLPTAGDDSLGNNVHFGLVSGWGRTHENGTGNPAELQHAFLPIMTNRQCQMEYSMRVPPTRVVIQAHDICAGFPNGGKDACQGDSGGPLAVFKDGLWQLYGIVSEGRGCGQPHSPGIFTRVPVFVDWIKFHMRRA